MFNQLKSLLWLRKRVIKSNKSIILQILLPLGLAFLYKYIYEIQGSLNNSVKANLLVTFSHIFECISWNSNQHDCF